MRRILEVARLTLHEASRRRILLAMLLCGVAFLVVYSIGIHFVIRDFDRQTGVRVAVEKRMFLTFCTLAGLYAVNFLLVMTAVLLPVDALSGEISSGVMQTLAARPIRRSEIVLGKWIAYAVLVAGYLTFMVSGVLAIVRLRGGYTPPNVAIGFPLMLLEGVVLVTLAIAGGAKLSTVTNGVMAFGFYGLAFVANWVEQIGTMFGNQAARNVGTVASLIMPTESLWMLAASHMQPPMMRDLGMTPFSPVAVPTNAMVVWAFVHIAVVLALGVNAFRKRPL